MQRIIFWFCVTVGATLPALAQPGGVWAGNIVYSSSKEIDISETCFIQLSVASTITSLLHNFRVQCSGFSSIGSNLLHVKGTSLLDASQKNVGSIDGVNFSYMSAGSYDLYPDPCKNLESMSYKVEGDRLNLEWHMSYDCGDGDSGYQEMQGTLSPADKKGVNQ